ncbi:fructose-6-phosphate aldolase [Kiloniella sp. b19]|uniref:fructose-6-phosphate aldolase n=1 Tax=Kiloniella sp. GXU_MW_B19 TaxID=3141326 RepID=UPI0031E44E23
MEFFIDTADIDEIRDLASTGLVDGVTTNPSLIAKSGRDILEVTKEIAETVSGPVSAEVTALDYDGMIAEGRKLAKIADNIVVKLPLTEDGLKACKTFSDEGIKTNVTLCFSAAQALLAAKAGATYVSPFVGRLDDIGQDGLELIADIVEIFENFEALETKVLVASTRNPYHIVEAAKLGAHVATIPPKVLRSMYSHHLTDKGLDTFMKDWASTGQSIL